MTTHPDLSRWDVPTPWNRRTTVLAVALGAVLTLVTVNAVYGGIGLIRDGMGMPADWADRLPFGSWTVGGLALLATVAAPQAIGLAAVATRHRSAALIGAVVGVALVAWIAVQLLILQRFFFLQPIIAVLGVLEVALAVALRRSVRSGVGSDVRGRVSAPPR